MTQLTQAGLAFSNSSVQTTAYTGFNRQIFTTSGTWTPPPGVTKAIVSLWGGGGGGYGGDMRNTTTYYAATPGKCGGFVKGLFNVAQGNVYTVEVGAGGNGGAQPFAFTDPTAGSPSRFKLGNTTLAKAYGGDAGGRSSSTDPYSAINYNDTFYAGAFVNVDYGVTLVRAGTLSAFFANGGGMFGGRTVIVKPSDNTNYYVGGTGGGGGMFGGGNGGYAKRASPGLWDINGVGTAGGFFGEEFGPGYDYDAIVQSQGEWSGKPLTPSVDGGARNGRGPLGGAGSVGYLNTDNNTYYPGGGGGGGGGVIIEWF